MSDPFRIFGDGREGQREALSGFWPELYESLARLDAPTGDRNVPCALALAHPTSEPRKAVGRIARNGTPACQDCFIRLRDRPVYPLALTDPRETP